MAFTLDVLGGETVGEEEADRYMRQDLDLLEALTPTVARWERGFWRKRSSKTSTVRGIEGRREGGDGGSGEAMGG